jgi:hypothetical protein
MLRTAAITAGICVLDGELIWGGSSRGKATLQQQLISALATPVTRPHPDLPVHTVPTIWVSLPETIEGPRGKESLPDRFSLLLNQPTTSDAAAISTFAASEPYGDTHEHVAQLQHHMTRVARQTSPIIINTCASVSCCSIDQLAGSSHLNLTARSAAPAVSAC